MTFEAVTAAALGAVLLGDNSAHSRQSAGQAPWPPLS
jgi:hypothetical protein